MLLFLLHFAFSVNVTEAWQEGYQGPLTAFRLKQNPFDMNMAQFIVCNKLRQWDSQSVTLDPKSMSQLYCRWVATLEGGKTNRVSLGMRFKGMFGFVFAYCDKCPWSTAQKLFLRICLVLTDVLFLSIMSRKVKVVYKRGSCYFTRGSWKIQ